MAYLLYLVALIVLGCSHLTSPASLQPSPVDNNDGILSRHVPEPVVCPHGQKRDPASNTCVSDGIDDVKIEKIPRPAWLPYTRGPLHL